MRRRPEVSGPDSPSGFQPAIGLTDIVAAGAAIAGQVTRTPCRHSRTLSEIAGCEVWVKFENLQFTGAFKERGALNKLLSLTLDERERGVIAMSAGNHAQGVAYHATRLGIPATIVMPEGTPFTKIRQTRNFGAQVLVKGENLIEAQAFAEKLRADEALTLIHPYDDPLVVAGQGTIAIEMLEDVPELDTLIVPVGGGGLIAGMAIAAQSLKPGMDIVGVQTALYPSMYRAIRGETGSSGGTTVAEGVAVQTVAERPKAVIAERVSEILQADEAAIEHAIALFLEVEKTVAEGAGAIGLAALLGHPERFQARKVGLVLSAGNIDSRLLASVILRELSRAGRISIFHVELIDRPGSLAKIATVIGEAGGNIIEVLHNRMSTEMSAKDVAIDITVETRDAIHREQLGQKIAEAGFLYRIVSA